MTFARAKAAGASFFEEVHETVYGERQHRVLDLEGHPWLFSRHARDLSPWEWAQGSLRGRIKCDGW